MIFCKKNREMRLHSIPITSHHELMALMRSGMVICSSPDYDLTLENREGTNIIPLDYETLAKAVVVLAGIQP